jgi:hypothetical protein
MIFAVPPAIPLTVVLQLTQREVDIVHTISLTAASFLPSSANTRRYPDAASIVGVMREAHTAASTIYGMREAQEWADGFVFPKEARERDANLFNKHGGSVAAVCSAHHNALASNRFSIGRLIALTGEHGERLPALSKADFERAKRLAQHGIIIQPPKGFIPVSIPPAFRDRYVSVSNAVNKLLYTQWEAKTVILLPTPLAITIPGIHFSPQHWAVKKGKKQGRSICDTANSDTGLPVNGKGKEGKEEVRNQVREEWGVLKHPTIEDLILMILKLADEHGWDEIELWKLDLAAAFNLIRFALVSIVLLAFALTTFMTAIHITGMFGWTGTPYAFGVITRLVEALSHQVIQGKCRWYVDDCCGCSRKKDRPHDMAAAIAVVRALLGSDAIAISKNDWGRRLEFIGWIIDLDKRLVTISHHGFLKTVHAFFSVDVDAKIYKHEVEVMASLASRYSMLCRQMRPYTKSLYDALRSYGENPHKAHNLSKQARFDILMWRTFLVQLDFNEISFARSLESFKLRIPWVLIEYDASLGAFGVGVSTWDNETSTFRLRAYTTVSAPEAIGDDSSYQNTCEFCAIILGLLLARGLGLRGFAYHLAGDSVSSLAWASHDRVNSSLARAANIGFALLSVDIDAVVADTRHVPGVENVVWDGLSRGKSGESMGLDPRLQVEAVPGGILVEFLALCDPTLSIDTQHEHTSRIRSFLQLLTPTNT